MNKDKEYYRRVHNLQVRPSWDNYFMYGYMKGLGIDSVFEFGCNAGRHLKELRKLGMTVKGVDLSPKAVNAAKAYKLDVSKGDEKYLRDVKTNSFDATLTVSVLNHIKNIDGIVKNLKRIAKDRVIICECNTKDNEGTKSPWYIHDYEAMGFEPIRSHNAGKGDAIYTLYEYRQHN